MEIAEIKQRLHSLIDATNDENVLVRLLNAAELKPSAQYTHEEDYDELLSLVKEPPEKDTISYTNLKSSLSRWFTK